MREPTDRDAGQQPGTMETNAGDGQDSSVNPNVNVQTSPAAERAAAAPDSDEITGATPDSKQSQI